MRFHVLKMNDLIARPQLCAKPNFVRAAARPYLRKVRRLQDEHGGRWEMEELVTPLLDPAKRPKHDD